MNALTRWSGYDSLRNLLAGLGVVDRDKAAMQQFYVDTLSREQLESAYRGNWLSRKIVDIPAFDSCRAWRNWKAENDQIEKIEEAEREFNLQRKLMDGLSRARLYGGAALVIGVRNQSFEEELDVERVGKGQLAFVHVVNRWQIQAGPLVRDITSPWYGEPEYYQRTNAPPTTQALSVKGNGSQQPTSGFQQGVAFNIHPSRVVRLLGLEYPDPEQALDQWGDSALQPVVDAIKNAGLVSSSVANLTSRATVDVIKLPGLSQALSTVDGTKALLERFSQTNVSKSVVNAILLDEKETWEQLQVTFSGLPQVLQMYLAIAAGAADIPATRLLGRSPEGMNATGDSDTRNYYDRLSSDQAVRLKPLLSRLDEVLLRHVFGDRDEDIHYEWAPLWQMDDEQKANVQFKKAQAHKIDVDSGLIAPDALRKGREAQLVEDGVYPGFEQALEEAEAEAEAEIPDEALTPHPALAEKQMQREENAARLAEMSKMGGGGNGNGGGSARPAPRRRPNGGGSEREARDSVIPFEVLGDWADFNPDQPREPAGSPEGGQWASAGGIAGIGGVEFASPNVRQLDFKSAHAALRGPRQGVFIRAAAEVDTRTRCHGEERNVIGAWSDGAENSTMLEADKALISDLRFNAAVKGILGRQKQVLIFDDADGGPHRLYQFSMTGEIGEIHQRLLDAGLAFHTLVPRNGHGADVVVVDLDGSAEPLIGRVTNKATVHNGTAEFLGTQKQDGTDAEQRADAKREFAKIIAASGTRARLWKELRDRWAAELESAEAQVALDYDPDQPREPAGSPEGGQWTSGGAGGESGGGDETIAIQHVEPAVGAALSAKAMSFLTNEQIVGLTEKYGSVEAAFASLASGTEETAASEVAARAAELIKSSPPAPPSPDPEVMNVGGDIWNKQTAERLEREYATAKPELEALANDITARGEQETLPESEDDEDQVYVPDSWESMTGDMQASAEESYMKSTYDDFYNSEVENWSSEQAPDDARYKVAEDFKDGSETEWVTDALVGWLEDRDDSGKAQVPYTTDQLLAAITIEHETGNYPIKKGTTIDFDDEKLKEPKGYNEAQATLPGIEPIPPEQSLTAEMRNELTEVLETAFDKEAERIIDKLEPPEYLSDSVKEYQEDSWGQMEDADKFSWVTHNTSIISDLEDEQSNSFEKKQEAGIIAMPTKFDPLGAHDGTVEYRKTQGLARAMAVERAMKLIRERVKSSIVTATPLTMSDRTLRGHVESMDRHLWDDWKGSSTSQGGMIIQHAAADELGGRSRTTNIYGKSRENARDGANARYSAIGGYDAVKAYMRAKWETTQYLLDKANIKTLQLYRCIKIEHGSPEATILKVPKGGVDEYEVYNSKGNLSSTFAELSIAQAHKKELDEQSGASKSSALKTKVVEGRTLMPDVHIERNGAASFSTDLDVANRWDGSDRTVIRVEAPRTAAISVPAYGINVHGEHEVVVAGTAWKGWDAWLREAPSFWKVGLQ